MRLIHSVLLSSLFFLGCTSSTTDKTTKSDSTTVISAVTTVSQPVQSKLNSSGTSAMMNMVNGYYAIKNALVATDARRTDSMARAFTLTVDEMQAYINKDTSAKQLQPSLDTIYAENKALLAIKDPSCELQRIHFSKISDVLFTMLKKMELKNGGVYREFCPMAFNEKGAFWLSNESEIKNPYFGKKMLECGDIADSLK